MFRNLQSVANYRCRSGNKDSGAFLKGVNRNLLHSFVRPSKFRTNHLLKMNHEAIFVLLKKHSYKIPPYNFLFHGIRCLLITPRLLNGRLVQKMEANAEMTRVNDKRGEETSYCLRRFCR